ncbi:hypothetical protein [Paenibacillus oceani]|uniref:Uncharacterized protein n=1 Tax=Paenibacillus oceani TaxID=2772510 RepID=A0A927GYZ6_9BACL|nr:hypothetical protein [Paenibacillus oceani]MBD2860959.1 hypothetical protein [Paenibacillus oceani]
MQKNTGGSSWLGCLALFVGLVLIFSLLPLLVRFGWVILILAALGSAYWFWHSKNKARQQQRQAELDIRETAEKIVLQIAVRNEGLITPMEVVLASDMNLEEAGEMLEQLRKKGYAKLRVAENGSYVYELNGPLTPQQKRKAEKL